MRFLTIATVESKEFIRAPSMIAYLIWVSDSVTALNILSLKYSADEYTRFSLTVARITSMSSIYWRNL